MIPVQKDFPPERLRYMRKVMMNDKLTILVRGERAGGRPDEERRETNRLPVDSDKSWIFAGSNPAAPTKFDRWKLAQQRQDWLRAATGGMVLCLLIFVVSGGCK